MRDEATIFQELGDLCRSPGYVHALASLCFRDNVIRYAGELDAEDMSNLFSPDRLIRTETSTLIGLMVQGDLNVELPKHELLQQYIDTTEQLLKEIHQSMSAPAFAEMIEQMNSGPVSNPFASGSNLREPIFYGGESAYSFQFRDIAVPKYQADDAWLHAKYGFTIQMGHDVVRALIRLQNDKLGRTFEILRSLPPEEWTLLPAFSFNAAELSLSCGLELPLVETVLRPFVLSVSDKNSRFHTLSDFNAVTAKPMVQLGDGSLVLFEQYSLAQALYESPFYWMCADKLYIDAAMKHRGQFVERFTASRLQRVFGEHAVNPNVILSAAKGKDAGEIDVLVLFGDRAIVLQAKSKRMTLEARKGNDNLIQDDFKKSVQDSYDQGLECAKLLASESTVLIGSDGQRISIRYPLKEIFIFCAVADHYPALSFQARQFLKYEVSFQIQPPFVMDVFTLDAMAEMLDTPLQFLSYIRRRASYHEKIHAAHELTILGFHLKRNLWFEEEYSFVGLEDDFTTELDVAMTVRREGVSGKRTPDGILTRYGATAAERLIKAIESVSDPRTINLGFALLALSEKTVLNLSRSIDSMTAISRLDHSHHDLSLPMGHTAEGITIHCNSDPLPVASGRLEDHCKLRKYTAHAKRWYGICLWPDGSLRFGITLDFEWKVDSGLEDQISQRPSSGQQFDWRAPQKRMRKIGRNDPCPCSSGRKYKKCCGRW